MTTTPRIEPRSEKPRPRAHRTRDGKWLTTAYVSDNAPIPRGRRRVLLDLVPDTIRLLLEAVRLGHAPIHGFVRDDVAKAERILVEALELSR